MTITPIKVSCVSFINSLPFVYGLKRHPVFNKIELSLDSPAECAYKLSAGSVDIGLIPVAAINSIKNANQVTNWCIGSNGPVKSVTLVSDVEIHQVEKIFLDFQSVTSNLLTRILAARHWKIDPEFISSNQGYEKNISGNTAAIIIGDRSLILQKQFKYVYDLSEAWKNFTGLPFVFARWVSNKPLDSVFLQEFDDALAYGIENIDQVLLQLNKQDTNIPGLETYLKHHLSYNFDAQKKEGMNLFLDYAKEYSAIKSGSFMS